MQIKKKHRTRTRAKIIIRRNIFKIINPCHFEEKYEGLLGFVEKLLIYERNFEKRGFLKENIDVLKGLEKN